MVTLKNIAEASGVSIYTVSRILNGQRKDKWPSAKKQAEKVRAIAKELNYVPNSAARAMQRKKFNHIGVVIPGKYTAMYDFEKIMGAEKVLSEKGYSISVICLDELKADHGILNEKSFDGMMVMGLVSAEQVQKIKKLSNNCVWVDNNQDEPECCIKRDEYDAGKTVAEKVAELGYKKVIYVGEKDSLGNPAAHFCRGDRYAGVYDVLSKHRDINFELVEFYKDAAYNVEIANNFRSKLSPETAVISLDLTIAETIAFNTLANGLCAGRDFALVSCDETTAIHNIWPGLSRMTFDRQRLGVKGAQMLLDIIEDDAASCKSISIKDEWFPGETISDLNK